MDGQEEALGGGVAPLHGLEEERKGAGAHLVHRSHNGGEGGGGELAERKPIKADDGDGARDLDSGIVKKPEQADRDGIAEGDDGGGFLSCALPEAATGGGPPGKGQFARLVQPGIGGEAKPLETLAEQGELAAFSHEGFWQPMDTLRDRTLLEELWASGRAPWKVWT